MTVIRISSGRRGIRREYAIEMDGHAGFNPGNDVVCAALSCLFFSLCNYLGSIASPEVEIVQDGGYGSVRCLGGLRVRLAFEFCVFAFRMLSSSYPENVVVCGETVTSN